MRPLVTPSEKEDREPRLEPGNPVGDAMEGDFVAVGLLPIGAVEAVAGVVGRNDLDDAVFDAPPDFSLVRGLPRRGTAHELRALETGPIQVGAREHEVLGARLADDVESSGSSGADLVDGLARGEMHDVHSGVDRLGQRDDAVHRLSFRFGRMRDGVEPRCDVPVP